jgi:hypothetical protein
MLHLISEEASADLEEITDYFLNVSVEAGDSFVKESIGNVCI